MPELIWLPPASDWQEKFAQLDKEPTQAAWEGLVALANTRVGFAETLRLDRALLKRFASTPPPGLATKPVRLAILGSSTVEHLLPGLRVGALRRGIWLTLHTTDYGQYRQELLNPESRLHHFKPTTILFALDALHLFGHQNPMAGQEAATAALESACDQLVQLWRKAHAHFGCQILQQTALPVAPPLLGHNEHRLPNSHLRLVRAFNERLRALADGEKVDLVALDERIALDGLAAWHDPVLWHKAKQEIGPLATPFYGDMVARLIAAQQGRSYKCLVLDLDNTLWGGVIGDDGLEGIKLGQGSPAGEAFVALQRYARDLAQRGVILAVCSKNDEANAHSPFDEHPEMVLKRSDIACFVANWEDKASNLRRIAAQLNIGIDSLVFADDNPFERNIVRRELPMVAVPELPEDPALYPKYLAEAGYFEGLHVTAEDLERGAQYHANQKREELKGSATDLEGYLRSLNMELQWSPFDAIGLKRIVQLVNKTNQFNLTTRRYTDADVAAIMADPAAFTLQLRLIDQFGDNGIIGAAIGLCGPEGDARIDTWLMSCRVLGRGVEETTLNLVAAEAIRLGARRLVGEYLPTAKNGMVKDHYAKLGFAPLAAEGPGTRWELSLATFEPRPTFATIKRV
jgi:FkbH-like protein